MTPKIKVMGQANPEEQAAIVTAVMLLTQATVTPATAPSQLSHWQKAARARSMRQPLETRSTTQRSPWQS